MRGRKPTAPALQVIQGGGGATDTGVHADPKAPPEPKWMKLLGRNTMSRDARAEWKRVVPELDKLGIIALLDARLLGDYCICCAQLDHANREVAEHGFGVMTERGEQKNPAVTAANQCRTQLKFYISELGLSPTSRLRLALPKSDDEDDLGID